MVKREESVKLLKECDAGTQMGISSLEQVIDDISNRELRSILEDSRSRHQEIKSEIDQYLNEYGEEGKEPAMMATVMAKMKENMKMMTEREECAAANVIIDGCNMGIKSIYKYFNQYPNAEERVKGLVNDIVEEEEALCCKLRCYL
ncbi:MAG: hypothetical protein Q4B57_06745 [Eubacteriales bacterium]|nr:hypothetical protein [Eubacteriales bacterium]